MREKQPKAVIFIQSIFHTTQKKSDSSYFKNEVINERNAAIAQLADGKTIFYLDLNPLFDDENGALRADYSLFTAHYSKDSPARQGEAEEYTVILQMGHRPFHDQHRGAAA